ncbi:MAG: hypothetical protein ACD_39C01319G0002 [uncultured bacterium]|nr:MAG: hypothetical protein ACD_39C01319G0002 [uncultured bacterium]
MAESLENPGESAPFLVHQLVAFDELELVSGFYKRPGLAFFGDLRGKMLRERLRQNGGQLMIRAGRGFFEMFGNGLE